MYYIILVRFDFNDENKYCPQLFLEEYISKSV